MMKELYRHYKKLLFAVEANSFFQQKALQKTADKYSAIDFS